MLHGVRDVVKRLTSNLRHVHLSSQITSIQADPTQSNTASIHCTTPEGDQIYTGFNHIIFATQASRAVPLLATYAATLPPDALSRKLAVEEQINCLQTFKYCSTVVVNHTDGTLIPDDARDRRDLNLICLDRATVNMNCAKSRSKYDSSSPLCVPSSYTMATHVLPTPEGYPLHSPVIYQTTNPIIPPREECVLSVAKLERAVLTLEAKVALEGLYREEERRWWQSAGQGRSRLGRLQGAGRMEGEEGPGIWICGSFAYAGIPLLEGCVVSARNVVEQGVWASEGVAVEGSPW